MKSVLISIQPYWFFLIVAKAMGWDCTQEKTIEVRKTYPKGKEWNRIVEIYCTKDKKSFNRIPKEYQLLMAVFLGKVVGRFVCDETTQMYVGKISTDGYICLDTTSDIARKRACLTERQLYDYANGGKLYGWHISDLQIYDKPRELNEFCKPCNHCCENCNFLDIAEIGAYEHTFIVSTCINILRQAPQNWCYIEE